MKYRKTSRKETRLNFYKTFSSLCNKYEDKRGGENSREKAEEKYKHKTDKSKHQIHSGKNNEIPPNLIKRYLAEHLHNTFRLLQWIQGQEKEEKKITTHEKKKKILRTIKNYQTNTSEYKS